MVLLIVCCCTNLGKRARSICTVMFCVCCFAFVVLRLLLCQFLRLLLRQFGQEGTFTLQGNVFYFGFADSVSLLCCCFLVPFLVVKMFCLISVLLYLSKNNFDNDQLSASVKHFLVHVYVHVHVYVYIPQSRLVYVCVLQWDLYNISD